MTCPGCRREDGAVVLSAPDRVTGDGERFDVVRCGSCGMAYTRPQPADPAARYPEASYHAFREVRPTPLERLRLGLTVRVAYAPLARRAPGRLLDVGCGSGRLAAAFRRRGWEVCGVEPSAAGAAVAAASGMAVHQGTIDDAPWPPGSFDAIVFNHSLEHVNDPQAALAQARRLLRPGGLVAATVPNFGSWQRRLFGPAWFQLDLPRHLQHFDRRTLRALLEGCGLEPVSVRTSSMMPGLLGSLQLRLFGRLVVAGRAFRVANLALYPLVALSSVVAEGDCVNAIARRP